MSPDKIIRLYVGDGDFSHKGRGWDLQERMRTDGWTMVRTAGKHIDTICKASQDSSVALWVAGSFAGACVGHAVEDGINQPSVLSVYLDLRLILSAAEFIPSNRNRDVLDLRAEDFYDGFRNKWLLASTKLVVQPAVIWENYYT
jgi:hypothetical protein